MGLYSLAQLCEIYLLKTAGFDPLRALVQAKQERPDLSPALDGIGVKFNELDELYDAGFEAGLDEFKALFDDIKASVIQALAMAGDSIKESPAVFDFLNSILTISAEYVRDVADEQESEFEVIDDTAEHLTDNIIGGKAVEKNEKAKEYSRNRKALRRQQYNQLKIDNPEEYQRIRKQHTARHLTYKEKIDQEKRRNDERAVSKDWLKKLSPEQVAERRARERARREIRKQKLKGFAGEK